MKLSGMISKATSSNNLLRLFAENKEIVNGNDLANLWNKLGRQRDASDPQHRQEIRRMIRKTIDLIHTCDPHNLANIAHGAAKASLGSEETGILFDAMERATVSKGGLRGFYLRALSNMVWAFAKAGVHADKLDKMVANEAVQRQLQEFKPQEISSMVWAFVTAGVHVNSMRWWRMRQLSSRYEDISHRRYQIWSGHLQKQAYMQTNSTRWWQMRQYSGMYEDFNLRAYQKWSWHFQQRVCMQTNSTRWWGMRQFSGSYEGSSHTRYRTWFWHLQQRTCIQTNSMR